jgi:hypothetical protein
MTTLEGNKLISSFMGLAGKTGNEYPIGIGWCTDEHMQYHSSWDWLMPVVEKIEAIENSDDYEVDIFGNCCEIGTNDNHSAVGKTKIEATWKAVVQFIQWYNQNKKEQ